MSEPGCESGRLLAFGAKVFSLVCVSLKQKEQFTCACVCGFGFEPFDDRSPVRPGGEIWRAPDENGRTEKVINFEN